MSIPNVTNRHHVRNAIVPAACLHRRKNRSSGKSAEYSECTIWKAGTLRLPSIMDCFPSSTVSRTDGPQRNSSSVKGMGLVNEVFNAENLDKMKGDIGVGHVRYSTAGASVAENTQPLVLNYIKGTL
mgnify:CR=1 FL=1